MSNVLPVRDRRWIVSSNGKVYTHPDNGPQEPVCSAESVEIARQIADEHNRTMAMKLLSDTKEGNAHE